ncbi:MAG: phage/plasmid primase, P4 family [Pirellulaceae bacterium]
MGNLDPAILDGRHHPCPKCGGEDRFRAFDDGSGGAICNKCLTSKNGDGFAVLQWMTGEDFGQVLKRVAEYLGVRPSKNGKQKSDPAEHLKFHEWNDCLIELWRVHKPPVTSDAVRAFGARLATYRGQWQVVAIPVWGELLDQADPVGWILYPLNGRTLPKYTKGKPVEWVKVKVTFGSESGLVGPVEQIAAAETLWKLEGPTDALAVHGILPDGHVAVTNSNGAKERPKKWIVELATGKRARVIHDADRPGQDGAMFVGEEDGRQRPGWAPCLASTAEESRNVLLPYPIVPDHGKDVRDWLNEGHTFEDLEQLADQVEPVSAAEVTEEPPKVLEADDDPHRLAKVNIAQYAAANNGATIKFWRDEWYTWKGKRYRKIPLSDLRAKITRAVKAEFDRIWQREYEEYRDWQNSEEYDADKDKGPPKSHKVPRQLISNVLDTTKDIALVPSHIELGTWLDDQAGIRERRNYVAMENGILDIDIAMEDREADEYLTPHSPAWFSTTCLPYPVHEDAKCPKWDAFLAYNLEGDPERIAILQEWAGYCLLPDTGQQRFLVLEGEGANGKSVYFAALEAMLGSDNVSHVPLETFYDRFSKTQTLGKLANISPDTGEIEKQSEGTLKSFTAGERMMFDRKGIDAIEAYPTARLMIGCNNRPRFSDKSDGIWRRMILIPFRVTVPERKRIPNMDKAWWWERSGELPGIFLWAINGLHRLRTQGGFTTSTICTKALASYREELNPAACFCAERYIEDPNIDREHAQITPEEIYDRYKRWCVDNGFQVLSINTFGREIARRFPTTEKARVKRQAGRANYYLHLRARVEKDEIDAGPEQETTDKGF